MIETEVHDQTLVLRLAHGKASALDLELLQEMLRQLKTFREGDARAMVLTGKGSIFCAGVDLARILEGGEAYVDVFLKALSEVLLELYTLPKPVIAAINGHAIAGGCLLAAACDHRMMVRGDGKIGVTELFVGVPFPVLGLEIMRAAYAPNVVQKMIYTGRLMAVEEALQDGVVDELVAPAELLEFALRSAKRMGKLVPATFAQTKLQWNRLAVDRAVDHEDMEEGVRVAWRSPEVMRVMRAFFEKTVGKR